TTASRDPERDPLLVGGGRHTARSGVHDGYHLKLFRRVIESSSRYVPAELDGSASAASKTCRRGRVPDTRSFEKIALLVSCSACFAPVIPQVAPGCRKSP